MVSNWPRLSKHQMYLNTILCEENMFGYCYHSVNGISYGLAQSEPIKRRPLYMSVIIITRNGPENLNIKSRLMWSQQSAKEGLT